MCLPPKKGYSYIEVQSLYAWIKHTLAKEWGDRERRSSRDETWEWFVSVYPEKERKKERKIYQCQLEAKNSLLDKCDYKYEWTHFIHTKTKIKTLHFLKLHGHYLSACGEMIFGMVYEHETHG